MGLRIAAAAIAAALALPAGAQQLDIKGVRLGMTKDQVTAIVRKANHAGGFSLGGVSKYAKSDRGLFAWDTYDSDGRLKSFGVVFDSSDYGKIEAAYLAKFPAATCSDSIIQNRMGAQFAQRECMYAARGEMIGVQRYADRLDIGIMMLMSANKTKEEQERAEKDKRDL